MFHLKDRFSLLTVVIKISFIIVWLSNLASTDSYFSVYVLIAFGSFYLTVLSHKNSCSCKRIHVLSYCIAFLFSFLVLASNYPIFTQIRNPDHVQASTNLLLNFLNTVFSFLGGIFVFQPVIIWIFHNFPLEHGIHRRSVKDKNYLVIGFSVFSLIAVLQLVHLFCVEYPGNVTEDTFSQIFEMCSGTYSNFNSFWHTMILQSVLSVGYGIFSDVNAAVAFYCAVQALVLSAAFTYCIMTLYLAGVPRFYLFAVLIVYGILPYNMALGITIWKDVLFAAGALIMGSAWYRIVKVFDSGKLWNYFVFVIGSLLFVLSRSNGFVVYFVSFLIMLYPLRRNKLLVAVMGTLVLLSWVLCNPVLTFLNVSEGDYSESLSVPLQQVSRVIADDLDLTEEETELISHVLDIEEVPDLYTSWLSDPIKVEFRSNDVKYFEEHIQDYVELWIRLGLRYPGEYFKAWVDQTKGYWNGGYAYAMYSETVTDNPYGIVKAGQSNIIAKLFRIYFGLSRHVIFFEPFHSIGLHVWIVFLCAISCALKKREEWMIAVPAMIVILAMCIGTPVYACFRYAYPLFAVFPLTVGVTVFDEKKIG